MQPVIPLEPGHYYHVYNRGVNRTNIFVEDRNYAYFMQLYAKYIVPVADTLAYCLLRNHFHMLVRIREDRRGFRNRSGQVGDVPSARYGLGDRGGLTDQDQIGLRVLDSRAVSRAFNNLLNAYAKAINKAYGRTGSLFQHHFGRLPVTSDRYFLALIHYIHYNPQKHGFAEDYRVWPYSSYHSLLSDKPTRLERGVVLDWFGGTEALRQFHATTADESSIRALIGEDEAFD